jgi:hypothetical protein
MAAPGRYYGSEGGPTCWAPAIGARTEGGAGVPCWQQVGHTATALRSVICQLLGPGTVPALSGPAVQLAAQQTHQVYRD